MDMESVLMIKHDRHSHLIARRDTRPIRDHFNAYVITGIVELRLTKSPELGMNTRRPHSKAKQQTRHNPTRNHAPS
jgi:hypothetical protein